MNEALNQWLLENTDNGYSDSLDQKVKKVATDSDLRLQILSQPEFRDENASSATTLAYAQTPWARRARNRSPELWAAACLPLPTDDDADL
jgi:hypothetical protein